MCSEYFSHFTEYYTIITTQNYPNSNFETKQTSHLFSEMSMMHWYIPRVDFIEQNIYSLTQKNTKKLITTQST